MTPCRNSVAYRYAAKNDAEMANVASCAPVNAGVRRSESGSIGIRARCSSATNAASSTPAAATSTMVRVASQPSSPPRSARRRAGTGPR